MHPLGYRVLLLKFFTSSVLSGLKYSTSFSIEIWSPFFLVLIFFLNLSELLCFKYYLENIKLRFALWARPYLYVAKFNQFIFVDMTDLLSLMINIYSFLSLSIFNPLIFILYYTSCFGFIMFLLVIRFEFLIRGIIFLFISTFFVQFCHH